MRRTRHRRRFHTDRIVSNRRARWKRESRWPEDIYQGRKSRFGYGALADRDPWDCGRPRCGCCHWYKIVDARRVREERLWRRDWGL